HARAARADAGALGVDRRVVGAHRDLGPVAGLARHVGDLDDALADLGDLDLEQAPDEVGVGARGDDPQPPGGAGDVDDVHLDAVVVLGVLARHLLGVRQLGLAPAEVDRHVTRVALLHDPGDHVADAALVLAVGEVALGLAQ